MEQLELLLVSLTPTIGSVIAAIILAIRGCAEIRALKNEVKDSSTIKEIRSDNRRLNAMHRQTLEELQELKQEVRTLSETNQQLTASINRQNREV